MPSAHQGCAVERATPTRRADYIRAAGQGCKLRHLFYNQKFVPDNPVQLFHHPPPSSPLATTSLFFVFTSPFFLVFFVCLVF